MFVTTLGMDNLDCNKMNAHFTACLREGLIHEWKQALLAPPLPLMLLNNSRLCSTHNHCSAFFSIYQRSTKDRLRILVKALKAPGHGHLQDLAYNRNTRAYPMSTVLATVAFLLLLDTSLLSQAGITHYSQQLTLQHSTKLLFVSYPDPPPKRKGGSGKYSTALQPWPSSCYGFR